MKLQIDRIDQHSFTSFINRLKLIDSFIYFKIKDGQVTVYARKSGCSAGVPTGKSRSCKKEESTGEVGDEKEGGSPEKSF